MGAMIGALRAVLGIDTALFETGLAKAAKDTRAFGATTTTVSGQMGVALGRVAGAYIGVQTAHKALQLVMKAGSINDAAREAGLVAESYQELRFAAAKAGASHEAFAEGSKKFATQLAGLRVGTGALSGVLDKHLPQLATQLRATNSTEDAYRVFADTIANVASEEDRLLLLQKAFGEQLAGPLLKAFEEGAAGLDRVGSAGREVGDVFDRDLTGRAEKWKEYFEEIGRAAEAAGTRITLGFLDKAAQLFNNDVIPVGPGRSAAPPGKGGLQPLPNKWAATVERAPIVDGWQASVTPALKLKQEIGEFKTEVTDYSSEIESVMRKIRTPAQELQEEFKNLNSLLERGIITTSDYGLAVTKLQNDFSGVTQAADGVADAFGSAFESMTIEGGNWRDATVGFLKDVMREVQRALLIQPMQKALSTGLQAAFGGFFGGGDVGLGSWLPTLGFASGGSFEVGGTGGIDSKMVKFMASPGELVEVHKGAPRGGGSNLPPIIMQNDFRGADAQAVAGIKAKLAQLERSIPETVARTVHSRKISDPGMVRA